ncbi:beta-glucosidase [Spirochaeta isovalerica]|uniref:Beta-glucosidase n=1 Tax=Spirochaeta isovalerica TaxID=150 RepID=A0A841RH22_9SPIO|nr:glycoside hydrolase family 3 C-terminal domain-containing protein [Spirochaeta isovalerica]MBB6481612.1 beta-glucosidase [Spirochaeta isovalerica]
MTQNTIERDNLRKKAEELCSQLTLEEKISMTAGKDPWSTVPVDRLGIPWIWLADGPHGLRRAPVTTEMGYGDQLPATCFPTASALAASWDRDLLEEVGQALGRECRQQNVDVLLGPGVNIKRSPLAGRNFEYFSEDPLLSGEMGAAYIKGVQSTGVGACLKHFAANNIETRRMHINAAVDDRTLREIYLTPFEIAVKKGHPWTVMACYNRVQGTYGTENRKLLTEILKEEWKSDALVMSDWDAVIDRVNALKAGLHLQMPGGKKPYSLKTIRKALEAGELEASVLDKLVSELIYLILKSRTAKDPAETFSREQHHALARRIGSHCITLLKNEKSLLPLAPDAFERTKGRKMKITLLGEFAETPRYQGNGSSEVKPTRIDTVKDILESEYGDAMELTYVRGYSLDEKTPISEAEFQQALVAARSSDRTLILAGLPLSYESEGVDRTHIDLPPSHNRLIKAVSDVQTNTIVVLSNGSAVAMPWIDLVPAVLESWVLGQAGAGAIADVLFGKVNPSGKLAETFPVRLEDTPSFLNFPGEEGESFYGERMFVGYRWYDKRAIKPLFPFGHGLSYTEFSYSNLKLSSDLIEGDNMLEISLELENSGSVAGDEVVQLYIHDRESSLIRPEAELKGFAKCSLAPGEKKTMTFTITRRDLSFFDSLKQKWVAESGDFEVRIGSSSKDIRLMAGFTYDSRERIPYVHDEFAFISTLWKNGTTRAELCSMIPRWISRFTAEGASPIDAEIDPFLLEQPLIKLPHFTEGEITEEGVLSLVERCRTLE